MPSKTRVHAIARFAGADVRQVVAGSAFADVSPRALRLELQFFFLGNGQLRRGRGQFSIAGFAIARPMNDHVQIGLALRYRHSPLLGRGLGQHQARRGSRLAHTVVKAANGMRSVGVLISVPRVTDRLFEFHPLPVRIQFVRQNERDRSAAAGTHLRAVAPRYRRFRRCRFRRTRWDAGRRCRHESRTAVSAAALRNQVRNKTHAQDQGAGRNHSLQKTTPADVQNVVAHAFSPAAALIAARIRW